MRLGLVLVAPTIRDQCDFARAAERAGFESVWAIEFFNQHAFVRLAAVAQATERVRIGSAIAYAFMRTPVLAATAALDLDELSGGRMILGLGSGTRRMNERWYSMPFEHPPARRMREAVELVRAVFAAAGGGGLNYEGRCYRVAIPQFVRPHAARPSIPIFVAGVNRGMIRTAAAVADGLVGHPIFTRRYIAERVLPELEGSPCELAQYVICSIADDVDRARREARAQIAFYYSTRLYHTVLEPDGWRPAGEAIARAFRAGDFASMMDAVSDEMLDAIAVAGRPAEVRERLEAWRPLAPRILLYPPSVGVDDGRLRENVAAIVETFGSG